MVERFEICPANELPPGERTLVQLGNIPVGVFNIEGEYHAMQNVCPHQLAPLCEGEVTGTTSAPAVGEYEWECDGEIVRCPWHGWEFEISSGESVFNPHGVRTRTFETAVEGGNDADSQAAVKTDEAVSSECQREGTTLRGDEPPVNTYDVEVESETVVVYI
ncbi:Rieske (2Fe-2S) protein [Natronosalvus rutilus]|uniref:Rieske (2Fe-2S) protein n=1 Tax=Natronosalvus rutilus TaxID=2953753 RepID=A0A9E7NEY3_9EURY|nr:Rieske (2Fe-2S) protein [Natronosalvus rutilus]UTF55760.1 Rieske (2Fe-2S) protein [Natronosalvus rutilus]